MCVGGSKVFGWCVQYVCICVYGLCINSTRRGLCGVFVSVHVCVCVCVCVSMTCVYVCECVCVCVCGVCL